MALHETNYLKMILKRGLNISLRLNTIPFLLAGWKESICSLRVSPSRLRLLQPGQQHGLQGDHVVMGQRQGLEPGGMITLFLEI